MNTSEYIQLRAFARNDGAYLGIFWIVSLACIAAGMRAPFIGTFGITLALLSPYFVFRRIVAFREHIRKGNLSFWNGYIYSMSMFFYASLLLAIAQYAYFAFIDPDTFTSALLEQMRVMLIAGQNKEEEVNEVIAQFRTMRPIDWSLYFMSMNIIMGALTSIFVALLTQKTRRR